jgi:hypothetical protein
MLRALAFGMLLVCLVLSGPSNATTLNELKVGIRVVEFMTNPPRGRTTLAFIYDAQNKASVDDATAMMGWSKSGIDLGKAAFVPTLVDFRQLDETPGLKVAFIAAGMEAHYSRVLDYARKNGTLTISADFSCARAGLCAVGVSSTPRIEVIISRQAALSCGIEFSEAFRMMVTEN